MVEVVRKVTTFKQRRNDEPMPALEARVPVRVDASASFP